MDSKLTDARLDELIALAAQDPMQPNDWLRDCDAALRELKRSRARIAAAPHAKSCDMVRYNPPCSRECEGCTTETCNFHPAHPSTCNCWKSNPAPSTAPRVADTKGK